MAAPQHHKCQNLQPLAAEGAAEQQQATDHRRQRGQPHRHAHLLFGDKAGDHRPLRADPLAVVGAGDRIAVIVGQIGEDLQQDGGQQGERHDGAIEGTTTGSQPRAQQDGRAGERQCSQTRRQQPNREGICHFVMAKQSDIDRVKGYRTGFGYTWPRRVKLPRAIYMDEWADNI